MKLNKYQQHLEEEEIMHELEIYGLHIEYPPFNVKTRYLVPGAKVKHCGENCVLLKLIEISDYQELWEVQFISEPTKTYVWL